MKKKFVGIFALLAIGLLLTGGIVSAFGPNGFAKANNDKIQQAIDNGDFQSWKSLNEERLTESEFARIQERHQERENRSLGREDLRAAIESNDYDAYSQAVLEIDPNAIVMSENDFAKLVEMHHARLDGDMNKWSELRDEIDFLPGEMQNRGFGDLMGRGQGHRMGQESGMAPEAGMGEGMHHGDCPFE